MTILPDKTIKIDYSVVGIGALILNAMGPSDTVSSLWERMKGYEQINTYEKFISGLVLLFTVGVIVYNNGVIIKNK